MALPPFIPVFFPRAYSTKIIHFQSLVTDKLDAWRETGEIQASEQSILGSILKDPTGILPSWMWGENGGGSSSSSHTGGDDDGKHQLVLQLMSILFAGHDTTTNLLAWITHFLSLRPDIQERIFSEISQEGYMDSSGDGMMHLRLEKLESCTWLNAVIKETLRLRPSAPALPRITAETHTIDWVDEQGVKQTAVLNKGG